MTLMKNKISLSIKKTEMVIFKYKQKKFEGDLKINYMVKDYILMKVFNTWVYKLIKTLVGNVVLMIFPLK